MRQLNARQGLNLSGAGRKIKRFRRLAEAIVIGLRNTLDYIVFDDVTFGSADPNPQIPEPATLTLLALGSIGMVIRRRRS